MKKFSGFPAGKVKYTSVPNLFFSELLPAIDDLAELKVTLHIWWKLYGKRGYPRCVNLKELLGDSLLLKSLVPAAESAEDALRDGLERAVARGTLLQVDTETDGVEESWYFANTHVGRRAVEKVRAGDIDLGGDVLPMEPSETERPNIFVLYEQNVGLLQPMIAEELKEAEEKYPASWIEEAFKIAVERNARNWRYIQSILERWAREGKDDGTAKRDSDRDRRRYIEGEYADYIEH